MRQERAGELGGAPWRPATALPEIDAAALDLPSVLATLSQERRLLGVGERPAESAGPIAPVPLRDHGLSAIQEPGVGGVGVITHRVGLTAPGTTSPVPGCPLAQAQGWLDTALRSSVHGSTAIQDAWPALCADLSKPIDRARLWMYDDA